ncbi:MAG: hypothetical protein CXT73_03755 [Methanobacteriota archaeon]|nr:MAG: hypothetical protein CXT73_03755 [Euryarchaeota archaeon]
MDLIKNLAENYPKNKEPIEYNIILEGGAFNGIFSGGALILVKELEKKHYLKVNKISGASVGALMGCLYFVNKLQVIPDCFTKLKNSYRKNFNFSVIDEIISDYMKEISDEIFNKIKKDKLYISYTIDNGERIIQNEFKDKKDLELALIKSTHLPYITTKDEYREFDNIKYLDGGLPYVFRDIGENNGKKLTLYLNNTLWNQYLVIKKEHNAYGRLLEGALDAHNFILKNQKGFLCSYVENWKSTDYLILRSKEFIFITSVIFMKYFLLVYNYLIPHVKDITIYKIIHSFVKECITDYLLIKCF